MPVVATFAPSPERKPRPGEPPPPKLTTRVPIKVGEALNPDPDEPASYRVKVGGIVPGYSGHRPGARDKYGGSAVGNVPHLKPDGPLRQGNMTKVDDLEDYKPGKLVRVFSTESTKLGNNDSYITAVRQYKEEVNGIIPGYAGHIPAARDEVGMTAFGNMPVEAMAQSPIGQPGLGGGIIGGKKRFEGKTSDTTSDLPEYRDIVGGVLPGYSGFVPAARDKFGATTSGGGRLTKIER